jgi:DNA-directed RNA polymerase specialized sigma24 family protein
VPVVDTLPKPLADVAQARQQIERTRHEARVALEAAEANFRQAIRDARDAGYSLERIGAALGVTRQRVAQLLEE